MQCSILMVFVPPGIGILDLMVSPYYVQCREKVIENECWKKRGHPALGIFEFNER